MVTDLKISRAARRELGIPRLCAAMQKSLLVLRTYRTRRKEMIRLYAGADWSDNAADLPRPLNLIGMYVNIVSRSLVNQTPRVMISTWDKKNQIPMQTTQDWCNRQFARMNLGSHLQRWVIDALFWVGIMKVGIVKPLDSERLGHRMWAGQPYAETIDPDDWVLDIHARNFDEVSYEGHRYRAPVDAANKQFGLTGEDQVQRTPMMFNQQGDERVSLIGRGFIGGDGDEFGDETDFWEVYLPRHKKILTFRSRDGGPPMTEDDLVDAREYIGPYCGPYTHLGYITVPGNLLPKGPVSDLIGLDESANMMVRKLRRQAQRHKQLDLYKGSASKDMEKINLASDGDAVQVDRLNEIVKWISNPPSPQLMGLMLQFKQLFSWLAGNLDTMGGLARMAGTAAQEQQLNQNSSATIAALQDTTIIQTGKVASDLCWYEWHDPQGIMESVYSPPKLPDEKFPRTLYPHERQQIDWDQIDKKVDPYSLSGQTPMERLQHIRSLVNMLIPILPVLQQQGVQLDLDFWLRKEGEYSNNPDVERLAHLEEPLPGDPDQQGQGQDQPGKPPITQRTYTRKSESEATQGGQERDQIQKMMGQGMNGAGDYDMMGGMK